MRLLLQDGRANPNALNSSGFRDACANGHVEIVRLLLLDGRAEPSAEHSEGLRYACKYGHTEMVELLLQDGRACPNALNSFEFRDACANGHVDIVKMLLKDGRADYGGDECLKKVLSGKFWDIASCFCMINGLLSLRSCFNRTCPFF